MHKVIFFSLVFSSSKFSNFRKKKDVQRFMEGIQDQLIQMNKDVNVEEDFF